MNGSGLPDHVEEQGDGTLKVGKSRREQSKERVESNDQLERIEAKLDLLLAESGAEK